MDNAQQLYQKAAQLALENDALEAELVAVLQRKPVLAGSNPVLANVQQEARKQALKDIQLALRPYDLVSSQWQGQASLSALQASADRSFNGPHAEALTTVFELCMEKHHIGKELALISRGGYVTSMSFSQVASLVLPTDTLAHSHSRMALQPFVHQRMQGATELRVAVMKQLQRPAASATHGDSSALASYADQYGQGMVANRVVLSKVTTLRFAGNTTPLPQLHVYAPNITKVVLGSCLHSEIGHAIGCLSLLPSLRCLAVTDASQALPLHQLTSVTHLITARVVGGTTLPPSLQLLEGAGRGLLPVAGLRRALCDLQGLRLSRCSLLMQFVALGRTRDVVCPMWGKLLACADDTCEVVMMCHESGTQDILYSNNVPTCMGLHCRAVRIVMIRNSAATQRSITGVLQIVGHMLPAATDITLELHGNMQRDGLLLWDSHVILGDLVATVRSKVVQPAQVLITSSEWRVPEAREYRQYIEQLAEMHVKCMRAPSAAFVGV